MSTDLFIGNYGDDSGFGRASIPYRNEASTTGDYNTVWRMTPGEYGNQFVKIASGLPWVEASSPDFGLFYDYGAASGKVSSYYMEAVRDGVVVTTTATISGSITLQSGWLHTVQKYSDPATVVGAGGGVSPLVIVSNAEVSQQLHDFAPYQLTRSVKTTTRQVANSSTPNVSSGRIQAVQIAIPAWSGYGANDYRAALRAIYRSDFYACFRSPGTGGMKVFGRLVPPSEKYGGATADVSFVFEQLSFDESVA